LSSAHANYYRLNYGDSSLAGMGLHDEQAGKPGFTGASFGARAKAAGYSGSVNENIGISGSLLVSLDWFMATINHRLVLLDPRYTDIGFGVVNDGKAKIEVIDVGTPTYRAVVEPAWAPWPPPDGKDLGTRFDGEAPNPFAGVRYPLGNPITLKYNGAGKVAYTRAQLTQNGLPVTAMAVAGAGFITKNTYLVAALAPLLPGTTYTVTVDGTLDGQAFNRTWSFTTRGTPPAATPAVRPAPAQETAGLPQGVATLDAAALARWRAADFDIHRGSAARTWTWGPDLLVTLREEYDEAADDRRTVYYFDKSRMEINNPAGDRNSPWFITNGLLVREMIAGRLQVGDKAYQPRGPALVTLCGDPAAENPGAATYASLAKVASFAPGQNAAPRRTGQPIVEIIGADGAVRRGEEQAGQTRYGPYDATLSHNIAEVFWQWLSAQPVDWVYAAGYPLTEPYWTLTKVKGVDTWVLVQAFERRLLTYVPGNPPGWQVEAGNVGRHYYEWRYGTPPPK
jgi:hypothetical protein